MPINWREIEWWYINLSHRLDRLEHIRRELKKVGLQANRFDALRKEDYRGAAENVMEMQHTPNTIGNWLSHTAVIGKARPGKVVGLLEDDALLCSDMRQRLGYIADCFHEPWDIFFLGATVHINDPHWHKDDLGRDCEPTNVKHIWRVYGAFSNQGYLINGESSGKILQMMQERMPYSRGSDHALIQIQPQLNCYCFVPGMVFQIDGQSDIGDGITRFSAFRESLGDYVWADRLEDFDYDVWVEEHK
jgi:GR25 family glycosyltransferase involved in LPS biosynthesis